MACRLLRQDNKAPTEPAGRTKSDVRPGRARVDNAAKFWLRLSGILKQMPNQSLRRAAFGFNPNLTTDTRSGNANSDQQFLAQKDPSHRRLTGDVGVGKTLHKI